MPDDYADMKAEEERDRRNKRLAGTRRELEAWMNRYQIPLLLTGFFCMLVAWPLGIVLMSTFLLGHAAIGILSMAPQFRLSMREIIIAGLTLALSLGLLIPRLGDFADIVGSLLLTAWIVVISVRLANAMRAEREKNPD